MLFPLFCLVFNEVLDAEVRSAFGAPQVSVTPPAVSKWSPNVTVLPTPPTTIAFGLPPGDAKDANNQSSNSVALTVNVTKTLAQSSANLCGKNTPCTDSQLKSTSGDGDKIGDRIRLSTTTTSDPLPSSTRRSIYIRGHLLASHHQKQTFVPPLTKSQRARTPDTASRLHVTHFKKGPAREGSYVAYTKRPTRRKKKHSSFESKRFDNFKFLHETVKEASNNQREQLEVYAWLLGAATLVAVSLTTLAGCFVTCFCNEKLKKYRAKKRQRTRDKGAEYERVESVSSLVDTANECRDSQYNDWDEPTDSVTVI